MQIYVRTPSGDIFNFEVESSDTIDQVKLKIQHEEEQDITDQQQLSFAGQRLKSKHTLEEYNISEGDTIDIVESQTRRCSIMLSLIHI